MSAGEEAGMTGQSLDHATRLAYDRTRLAYERTLMAWVRTATSLIAFGFTIFQVFTTLARKPELAEPLVSPRTVGATMIVVALVALALAWFQHRQSLKELRSEFGPAPRSLAGFMAGLIAVLGVLALLGVIART